MFKVRARQRERDTPTQRHTDKDRKRERSSADIGRKGDWQRVEEPLLKILCEFISSKSDSVTEEIVASGCRVVISEKRRRDAKLETGIMKIK